MKTTLIAWCNATVNFWVGCKKCSLSCLFCYMFRDMLRYGKDPNNIARTADNTFYASLKWKESKMIFTCSWSDFFIAEADEWRNDAWDVIRKTPQHNWLILTKRPERIMQCLPDDWGDGWDNVWLGVTAENQKCADKRIPILLNIPAKVKFLSLEPLLGPIDLSKYIHGINWNIIAGESGNGTGKYLYRECKEEWIESLIDQSKKAGVAVFVKQMGTHLQKKMGLKTRHGSEMYEFPTKFQIREFPENVNPKFIQQDAEVEVSVVKSNPKAVKNTITSNNKIAEDYVNSLSPFKKEIGQAILAGEAPNDVAVRFSVERKKPLKTYQAYATMVKNGLKLIQTAQ